MQAVGLPQERWRRKLTTTEMEITCTNSKLFQTWRQRMTQIRHRSEGLVTSFLQHDRHESKVQNDAHDLIHCTYKSDTLLASTWSKLKSTWDVFLKDFYLFDTNSWCQVWVTRLWGEEAYFSATQSPKCIGSGNAKCKKPNSKRKAFVRTASSQRFLSIPWPEKLESENLRPVFLCGFKRGFLVNALVWFDKQLAVTFDLTLWKIPLALSAQKPPVWNSESALNRTGDSNPLEQRNVTDHRWHPLPNTHTFIIDTL